MAGGCVISRFFLRPGGESAGSLQPGAGSRFARSSATNDRAIAERTNSGTEAGVSMPAEEHCGYKMRLAKWQIRFNPRDVRLVHERALAQLSFTLRVFCRKQMATRRLGAQYFAAGGNLKPLRDRFARFAA
jgi:hypothetical protein